MHKKDAVKQVLAKYIKKGHDFYELTPSFLGALEELKGYSERTLKRGRTEFKNENKNVVSRHSKASANLKKKVYLHLDSHQGDTPKKLQNAFPQADIKQLTKIRNLWKSEQDGSVEKAATLTASESSLRQKVFNYLSTKPGLTMRKLEKSFPEFNKKTLSNYLDQWHKDKTENTPAKSAKGKVEDYLTRHPTAKVKELKKALPELNPSSVNTYFSLWKKSQKSPAKGAKSKVADSTTGTSTKNDIIKALKETVEAQKKAIEALKSQNTILQERQSSTFPELEGMSKKDREKVESVIQTFIRGLRR